ncbi:MAG: fibronectin type III domain-containing protein [Lentisphaeria bacterium]|jgi:chitodextrinase
MKAVTKITTLMLALLLLVGMRARAAAVEPLEIISDTFAGAKYANLSGRAPDKANLPGGTWKTCGRANLMLSPAAGNAIPVAGLSCPRDATFGAAIAVPLASQGAYTKPQRLSISADFVSGGTGTQPALGFFPAPPVAPVNDSSNQYSFTGLSLTTDGTLILYQNGFPANSVKYTGAFDRKEVHHLSYDVDTSLGSITNVSLQGSTSDYSALSTRAFTDAATVYAGVTIPAGDRNTASCVGNFRVVADTKPLVAPAVPALWARAGKNEVILSWKAAGKCDVYRCMNEANPVPDELATWEPIASAITTPTYTDKGLTNDTAYRYKVKVTTAGGTSDFSKEADATPEENPGLRVMTCGNSFHAWMSSWLKNVAESAGIKGHQVIPGSLVGGSYVIQHWGFPNVQEALRNGQVDVMTVDGMHHPDAGITKFAELGLANNPDFRETYQEFWIPFDSMDWPKPPGGSHSIADFDNSTIDYLRKLHAPYFKECDDYIRALNARLGKPVVYVVPVGQAIIALREKVVAGEAPGITKQSDLFSDGLGHPKAAIAALAAYCHFAVVYGRTPLGLAIPKELGTGKNAEELNRLLQELAWDAVIHHPLSGVTGRSSDASETRP